MKPPHQGRREAALRLGAGAGFAGDRVDPAIELASKGSLDVLVFEVLAERTIALAQRRKRSGSGPGFDDRLTERLGAVLPATCPNVSPHHLPPAALRG